MSLSPKPVPAVHDRLYRDFFERRTNQEQLIKQVEEQYKGQAYPTLSQYVYHLYEREAASRRSTSPRESTLRLKPMHYTPRAAAPKSHQVSDSRLKVPERLSASPLPVRDLKQLFSLRTERYQSQPVSPERLLPVQREDTCPFIGKYYAQLSPVRMKVAYSEGCDVEKIVRGGKAFGNFLDARAGLTLTQHTDP